jgi:large-conductance mechanosensitive channel
MGWSPSPVGGLPVGEETTVQNLFKEFKEFISRGNVVMIAVGLVIALYFQKIVDAVLNGVINPIIAAIFGQSFSWTSASTSAIHRLPVRAPAAATRTSRSG